MAIKSHGMDERAKILMARDEFDINKLNDNQYLLFKQTWCRTNLLKIENKALKFPPPKKPGWTSLVYIAATMANSPPLHVGGVLDNGRFVMGSVALGTEDYNFIGSLQVLDKSNAPRLLQ